MASSVPVSSKPVKEDRYHHGNLEAALLQASLAIIAESGVDALSIRTVGARVGVSRSALYRHFASKSALLARLAAQGFSALHRQLTLAIEKAGSAQTHTLTAMAKAYVRFGTANPEQYRVMFGPTIPEWQQFPDLYAAATTTFALLSNAVADGQLAGRISSSSSPEAIAQVIWAQVHGIVALTIDGQLAHKKIKASEVTKLAQFALESLLSGIRAQA